MSTALGPGVPAVLWEGDCLRFVWPSRGITAEVMRFVDERAETTAEITYFEIVDGTARHILGPKKIALTSSGVADRLAKQASRMSFATNVELDGRIKDLTVMTEQVQTLALREHRKAPPVLDLADVEVDDGPVPHILHPLLPERAPTVLVANGGGGKSFLMLSIAIALASGLSLPGLTRPDNRPLKVTYLDWESNEYDHARRLKQLARGFGLDAPPSIGYRRVEEIVTRASWLRAELARENPDVVIGDSIAYMMGGDIKEAGPTTAMFREINAWGRTTLLAHHENRDGGFYGTIFIRNSCRSMWLMESVQLGQDLRLSLKHDKVNNGALHPRPLGLRLQFDDATRTARWHGHDIHTDPSLISRMPTAAQLDVILHATLNGIMEVDALAEKTGLSERTIKDTAKERPGQFTIANTQGGRGIKAVIALRNGKVEPGKGF